MKLEYPVMTTNLLVVFYVQIPLRTTPSVAEQVGQLMGIEAT